MKTIILILLLLPVLCISQKIKVKVENIDSTGSATMNIDSMKLGSLTTDSLYQGYLIFVRNRKMGRFLISSEKKDTIITGKHKIKIGKKYVMEIELFLDYNQAMKESKEMILNGRLISRKEIDNFAIYFTDDLIGLYYVR